MKGFALKFAFASDAVVLVVSSSIFLDVKSNGRHYQIIWQDSLSNSKNSLVCNN